MLAVARDASPFHPIFSTTGSVRGKCRYWFFRRSAAAARSASTCALRAFRYRTALKERFPDAEVWGIDVGGPMVRYAHHRSVGLGLDINFAQRLAEDTHFPDNYFDLVVANLVFHEVAAFATKKIYPEIYRITRKGGIWSGDGEGGNRRRRGSIVTNAATWVNHRYNIEPWQLEWAGLEPNDLLNDAGFVIDRSGGRPLTVKA